MNQTLLKVEDLQELLKGKLINFVKDHDGFFMFDQSQKYLPSCFIEDWNDSGKYCVSDVSEHLVYALRYDEEEDGIWAFCPPSYKSVFITYTREDMESEDEKGNWYFVDWDCGLIYQHFVQRVACYICDNNIE